MRYDIARYLMVRKLDLKMLERADPLLDPFPMLTNAGVDCADLLQPGSVGDRGAESCVIVVPVSAGQMLGAIMP